MMRWLSDLVTRAARGAGGGSLGARVASGGAAAFVVFLIGHGLAFLTQLLVARVIGAQSFGIYAYVLAWMTVLAYLAMLGFHIALLRFIPTYLASQSWPLLAGVVRYAEHRVMAVGGALVVACAITIWLFGQTLEREVRLTFLIALALVPLLSLMVVRSSMVRAYGGVVTAILPERLVRDGIVLVIVGFIWLVDLGSQGAPLIIAATVAASMLALAVATAVKHWLQPRELIGVKPVSDAPVWRRAILPLLVVTAVEALFDKTGVLVLGLAGLHKEAGVFALVFGMSMLVVLPRTAIDTIFAPTIAKLHAERRTDEVQTLILRSALLSLFTGALIALSLAAAASWILAWFGPEFAAGEAPLRILLLAQLFVAGAGSQLIVQAMTGNEAAAARLLVISAVINGVLCTIFTSWFGLTGAAVATAMALIGWNVLMACDTWRRLQIWPGVLGVLRPTTV